MRVKRHVHTTCYHGFRARFMSSLFQIVAVILCNTGIALLAYMDGVTGTPTLGGVVLAAAAAAGFAVHKVLFRRVMGDALTFCQASTVVASTCRLTHSSCT